MTGGFQPFPFDVHFGPMEQKAMTIEQAEERKECCKLDPILSEAEVEIKRHPEQIGYRLKITLPEEDARWANSIQDILDMVKRRMGKF